MAPLKSVRGGNGLGDAIYVRCIARHLLDCGNAVEVCTRYPDAFKQMPPGLRISPFRRDRITNLAHYTSRKGMPGTDQFKDCCINAGIKENVELDLSWQVNEGELVSRIRSFAKPVIIVSLARRPMGRVDGFGREILPDCRKIQYAINVIGDRANFVLVGGGESLFKFSGIDLDLTNKTKIPELFDVASLSNGALGYCSFLVPLAEALKLSALFVWSRRGLTSATRYVRQITPQKVLHRATSRHTPDDSSPEEIERAANYLLEQATSQREIQG